jgi:hypothetical protein
MARIDVSLPNRNHVVIGFSGSGKSTFIKQQTKRARRLLVWDPDEEYDVTHYRSRSAFGAALLASNGGPIRAGLSVDATPAAFEWFCTKVLAVMSADRPYAVVVEEINDVTRPGKAGDAWGKVCRRARKYGLQWFAATQRPQEMDKTTLTQGAFKWVGLLVDEDDMAYVARRCRLPLTDVQALKGFEYLYSTPSGRSKKRLRP